MFEKKQAENEKLGVCFWLDSSKHMYLTPDVDLEIDYKDLEQRHQKYVNDDVKKPLHHCKA